MTAGKLSADERKSLAYATALFEEHLNWRGDFCCLGIEAEVPVYFFA